MIHCKYSARKSLESLRTSMVKTMAQTTTTKTNAETQNTAARFRLWLLTSAVRAHLDQVKGKRVVYRGSLKSAAINRPSMRET